MDAVTERSVWTARLVLVASILTALLAGVPEGYTPPVLLVAVVAFAAGVTAFRPEHLMLSVTLGLVVVWWTGAIHDAMPVAVLVAAAGLTSAHVSATVLAYGPATLAVDRRLALLWAMRGALVWLASLMVWGVARVYADHPTPALYWLAGLAAALVGSVAVGVAIPLRDGRDEAGDEPRSEVRPSVRRGVRG